MTVTHPAEPAALLAAVWRTSTDQPGWAVVTHPDGPDSHTFRRRMLDLLADLGAVAGQRFAVERLGRFDQQVTTKFHRDGAPAESLLLLGYEPSPVRSRLFVADGCRAADAAGLEVADYLRRHNPMTPAGEARLAAFVSEVPLPSGMPAVVLLNNSLGPPANRFGVLHKGVIDTPDPTATRVINSIGAFPAGEPGGVELTAERVGHFLGRADLD